MSLTSGAAFWDERYAGDDFAYGLKPNEFLALQASLMGPGMKALVPGDGEGRNGVWLAEQGVEVDTLDLSAEGVAKAQRLAEFRGVRVNASQADALTYNWPRGRYDLVALIYLHLVAADRRKLHASAMAALKPGGWIVLEAFRPEQIERQKAGTRGGPRDAALLYSLDDLREDFGAGDIFELSEAETDLAEGGLHVGPSAVVRALVQKR